MFVGLILNPGGIEDMRQAFFSMIVLASLLFAGLASALDVKGTVIDVLDGATLNVKVDSKTGPEVLRVQLANLSVPSTSTTEGLWAKNFTSTVLLNRSVWLYVPENSTLMANNSTIIPCVVYLSGPDGRPVYPSFNEVMARSGYVNSSSDPLNQWLNDVWVPETLKGSVEMLETEIPAFSRIKETNRIKEPGPVPYCPDCLMQCPPDKECIA